MTQKPAKSAKRVTAANSAKPAAGVTAAKQATSKTAAKPATPATSATPAKPATAATAPKPAAPAGRTASSRTSRTSTRKPPTHDDVSERAYFLHLEQGDSDPVANWLRAERELASA